MVLLIPPPECDEFGTRSDDGDILYEMQYGLVWHCTFRDHLSLVAAYDIHEEITELLHHLAATALYESLRGNSQQTRFWIERQRRQMLLKRTQLAHK